MNRRHFLILLAAALPALGQKNEIEALLTHLGGLQGVKFVRNGKEYDAASAEKYLRHKWGEVEGVATPEDFITKVASVSSSSGKPYQLKFADGKTQDLGPYLRSVLATLK